MENLVSGLIVAAVGGLSFIAYRHPEEYMRVVWIVLALGAAMAFASIIYRSGLATGARFASNQKALEEVLDALTVWSWVGFGVVAYAVGLEFLPKILNLPKKNDVDLK